MRKARNCGEEMKTTVAVLLSAILVASIFTGCQYTEWKTLHEGTLKDVAPSTDGGAFLKFDDGWVMAKSSSQSEGCQWVVGQRYLYQERIYMDSPEWRMVHPECYQAYLKAVAEQSRLSGKPPAKPGSEDVMPFRCKLVRTDVEQQ